MYKRASVTVITALIAALALTGVASAAHAAGTSELPVDNSLYAVTCPYYSDTAAQTPNNQVLAVDEKTAVGSAVGTGTRIGSSNCAGSLTLDPSTGIIYALVAEYDGDFPTLVTVDLETGLSTKVAEITDGSVSKLASALAIGKDGAAYVLYNGVLYSLNLSNGVVTSVGPSLPQAWGFVSEPGTGDFYAVNNDGELFSVDVADGTFVSLATLSFLTGDSRSLTMDSNGVFWLGEDVDTPDEYQTTLWNFTLADPVGSAQEVGELTFGTMAPYSMALVVGPAYVASPAPSIGSRKLPVDNSLYAMTCPYYSDATAQTPNNQVVAVDDETGATTAIGTGTEIEDSNCAGSFTLDPTTGIVYALVAEDDYEFPTLVTVDLKTGVSTKVAEITDGSGPTLANALAIGLDGAAYVLYDEDLYSLNLNDGVMTYLGSSVGYVWGFVSDPVSGLFYALDEDGELYAVDVADGEYVWLATLSFLTDDTFSLAMDTNGVFWLGEDADGTDEYRTTLWNFTLADPVDSAEKVGELMLGTSAPYIMALVIGPAYVAPIAESVLAATGTTSTGSIALGITLLAAGAVLAVAARRRRSAL